MDTNTLFITATRERIRFTTPQGALSVEDLWDLPLTSANRANLDDLCRGLRKQLKEVDDDTSFVKPTVKKTDDLQTKFSIAKFILETKLAERDAAATAAEKKEAKQKLMALIDQKREKALSEKSEEELQALLKAL